MNIYRNAHDYSKNWTSIILYYSLPNVYLRLKDFPKMYAHGTVNLRYNSMIKTNDLNINVLINDLNMSKFND